MKKTLLLVFIHGFKGGDDTFGSFPEHLRALVSHALPNINVVALTYPRYETKGDLKECVARFREWLQDKVIDLEVANETPSPTIDPSVHTILIGHSMGGMVGAETLLLLASEQLLPSLNTSENSDPTSKPSQAADSTFFMFPHVQALLAFDTPFLGIAPGVVSHGVEEHYKTTTTAYSTFSEVAGLFGIKGTNNAATTAAEASVSANRASTTLSLPAPTGGTVADAAATPSWQRWGRYAMFAGAAGAVAAGGAAALYSQRERFTAGWSWVTSHLEFVGCLARSEELRTRVQSVSNLQEGRGIGSANFYTCLDPSVSSASDSPGSSPLSLRIPRAKCRTFCYLPDETDGGTTATQSGLRWVKALNPKASDEIRAHMNMFYPKENPSFYSLAHNACDIIVGWVDESWYTSSTLNQNESGSNRKDSVEGGKLHQPGSENDFMEADDVVVVD
ncbi:hypothetical protein V8E54_000334 [Elaphomyces granulatus]